MWGKVIFLLVIGVAGSSAILLDLVAKLLVSTDVNLIKFYYFPTPSQKIEIKYGDVNSLTSSGLLNLTTTVLIDGFLSSSETPMPITLRNSLLSENVQKNIQRNIIVVDWSSLSGGKSLITDLSAPLALAMYPLVLLNVVPAGQRVAEFLEFLRVNKGIDQSQVHIIGHSLGAHVAGKAGSQHPTSRLTGLDPAGPVYYLSLSQSDMIYKGNGKFVDLYHTSRGLMGDSRTGTGDIDVYVNGGTTQPGCTSSFEAVPGYCAHTYSWLVYNASIGRDDLYACPCSTTDPLLAPTCFCQTNCNDSGCSGAIGIGAKASVVSRGEFHSTITESFK